MENQSQTKNIANGAVLLLHIFDVDNFRGYIAWCSTSNEQIFICINKLGKTKICNNTLEFVFVPKENVFRF